MDIRLLQKAAGREGEKISCILVSDASGQEITHTVDSILHGTFPLELIEVIIAAPGDDPMLRNLEARYKENVMLVISNDSSWDLLYTAVSYASGQMLLFAEPGDLVRSNALEEMYTRAVLLHADLVIPSDDISHPYRYDREFMDIDDIYKRRELLIEHAPYVSIHGRMLDRSLVISAFSTSIPSLAAYTSAGRVLFAKKLFDSEISITQPDDIISRADRFCQETDISQFCKEAEYCLFYMLHDIDGADTFFENTFPDIRKNTYIFESDDQDIRSAAHQMFPYETKTQTGTLYILAPAGVVSGGPELLHQLCYTLNVSGFSSAIVYFNINGNIIEADVPDAYIKYNVPTETSLSVINSQGNIVIIPEPYTILSLIFSNTMKIIYWESVDFYLNSVFISQSIRLNESNDPLNFASNSNFNHIVQSHYAEDFLNETMHINTLQIAWLSDYINDEFFTRESHPKKPQLAYNPAKGFDILKPIINATPDLTWKPIEHMTPREVHELLLDSMLYIDFGFHPGKDRIPREAAQSGCIVITNMQGAAAYKDVPIPSGYKYADPSGADKPAVIERIRYILSHYDECYDDFADYRNRISQEKNLFNEDVSYVFGQWL